MKRLLLCLMLFCLFYPGPLAAEEEPSPVALQGTKTAEPPPGASEKVIPKKVEIDSDYDGNVDRTEVYDEQGQVARIEVDSNADGKVDEWITYENGRPIQTQRDSNGDGRVDVWIEY